VAGAETGDRQVRQEHTLLEESEFAGAGLGQSLRQGRGGFIEATQAIQRDALSP
jgi:hypothetical protein